VCGRQKAEVGIQRSAFSIQHSVMGREAMWRLMTCLPGVLLLLAGETAGEEYPLPPDSRAIEITQPPFSVKADGKTDCTAALNKALAPKGQFVYLPPASISSATPSRSTARIAA
jgi:hypothetical protein